MEANRLQYASTDKKVAVVGALTTIGAITLNEVREIFNMGSIEGGDKRLISLNYVDADKQNQYQVGGEDGKPKEDDTSTKETDGEEENPTGELSKQDKNTET
jgi:hypothetical protein